MTTDKPAPVADADAENAELLAITCEQARSQSASALSRDRALHDAATMLRYLSRHRLATTPPSPDSAVREAVPVWRLIDDETPRDGANVLLYPDRNLAGWGWCVGSWRRGVVYIHGLGNREVEGWWERGFFMGPQPTHWLPQPAPATPPAAGGEDGR